MGAELFVLLHQQKKGIYRKGQERRQHPTENRNIIPLCSLGDLLSQVPK